MKKSEITKALKETLQEEKPGLWANIRAKRARGEKPAHKNSKAHKDAVKAGKKINAMNEEGAEYDGIIGGIITRFHDLKKYVSKKEPDAMEDLQKVLKAFEIFDEKMAYGTHMELEEGEGKSLQDLEMGEKFTFNGSEYTFIELYPELPSAARVILPNGRKSVVSFGGKVNTGKKAGIGPDYFGQGKGHHID